MTSEKEYFFEVYSRGADPRGSELCEELSDLGIKGVTGIYTGNLFYLYGDLGEKEGELRQRIGKELLTDSVIEEYSVDRKNMKGSEIVVFFREGVLDIGAVRVLEALDIMGIRGIVRARTARRYVLSREGGVSAEESAYIAEKLLYNKIIERAEINAG
ncbi:MAG: phosphoribosylformylglycinamidine synthase subunit PurS [Elusimicrobia bacterium]|nr:phosphoribosylformylglycinamidine synthase subunit PurS [Elusimicrobiota bacterium]